MPAFKRSRTATPNRKPYAKRAFSARRRGRTGVAGVLAASVRRANRGVERLNRMIETKEGCWKVSATNVGYNHNTVTQISTPAGGNNPFARQTTAQSDDPMGANLLHVIGDSMAVKGMKATFMLENALERPKVYYRIMLLKGPRGAAFSTDVFKGITGNIMIDQINTERYTVIASRRLTVTPSNGQATAVTASGVPLDDVQKAVGTASRIVNFWIPGKRFGRNGILQYENGSSDLKYYDYKWVIAVYDWFGTPASINTVGRINEGYMKIYFKDA